MSRSVTVSGERNQGLRARHGACPGHHLQHIGLSGRACHGRWRKRKPDVGREKILPRRGGEWPCQHSSPGSKALSSETSQCTAKRKGEAETEALSSGHLRRFRREPPSAGLHWEGTVTSRQARKDVHTWGRRPLPARALPSGPLATSEQAA